MTRDDIIRMAREAWLTDVGSQLLADDADVYVDLESLTCFAALVAAAEREACAKVCEEQAARSEASMLKARSMKDRDIYSAAGQTARWNATAIRARGQA